MCIRDRHLLGKKWEVYAVLPSGSRVDAMKIDQWDFNWQGSYHFVKPIVLPKGSQIHAKATYDNTTDNPYNPNNPPKFISWGENTSDEMYYLPLIYMDYQAGDENLEFKDVLSNDKVNLDFTADKIFPIYPNPAQDKITVPFTIQRPQTVTLEVTDTHGKTLITKYFNRYVDNGMFREDIDIRNLPPGSYLVNVRIAGNQMTEKYIKQ